jgi:hypothetical protein
VRKGVCGVRLSITGKVKPVLGKHNQKSNKKIHPSLSIPVILLDRLHFINEKRMRMTLKTCFVCLLMLISSILSGQKNNR